MAMPSDVKHCANTGKMQKRCVADKVCEGTLQTYLEASACGARDYGCRYARASNAYGTPRLTVVPHKPKNTVIGCTKVRAQYPEF